jgi:geranylgeranyl pyrophosphate synthase
LLFDGLYLLHEAVRQLPEEKRRQILEYVKGAFRGISSAEAKEASFRGKMEMTGEQFFEIIEMKVAVAQATAKVGAVLGGASAEEVELLGDFGRTFGTLNTVRDEFIDIFEAEELKNRATKECLPLPILFTLENNEKKTEILQLLADSIRDKDLERILDLTLDSEETNQLTERAKKLMTTELQRISALKKCEPELTLLLKATLEDIAN